MGKYKLGKPDEKVTKVIGVREWYKELNELLVRIICPHTQACERIVISHELIELWFNSNWIDETSKKICGGVNIWK